MEVNKDGKHIFEIVFRQIRSSYNEDFGPPLILCCASRPVAGALSFQTRFCIPVALGRVNLAVFVRALVFVAEEFDRITTGGDTHEIDGLQKLFSGCIKFGYACTSEYWVLRILGYEGKIDSLDGRVGFVSDLASHVERSLRSVVLEFWVFDVRVQRRCCRSSLLENPSTRRDMPLYTESKQS